MSTLFHIIGLDAPADASQQWSIHWHRPGLLYVGALLLPLLAWLIARRHRSSFSHITPTARHVLTTCRVAVLLLLTIVLAGPLIRGDLGRDHRPVLIVLIDESASMSLPAASSDSAVDKSTTPVPSRASQIDGALKAHADTIFKPLAAKFDLRTYRFARTVRSMPFDAPARPLAPQLAEDTAPGDAIRRAIDDATGQPIAGIFLFTDGGWSAGDDPLSLPSSREGTTTSRRFSVPPVFTIPIGSAATIADVAVLDVLAPRTVAQNDVATLLATVRASGFKEKSIQVRLIEDGRELDKATITLRDAQPQRIELTFRQTQTLGQRSLRIVAEPWPGETVTQNNEKHAAIRVDKEKLRILLLESAPRWDYRFLDHALQRDKGIEATAIMEGQLLASGVRPAQLPIAANLPINAAGFAGYSLIMLGDISPDLLPLPLQEQLAIAVKEKGLGLIVQAGTQSMPQRFAGGPLGDLLPVVLPSVAVRSNDLKGEDDASNAGLEAPAFAPFHMKLTAPGALHPVFRLDDSAMRTRDPWDAMPPFHWAAAAMEGKPAATVLAEVEAGGRRLPLIAEQRAGRGKVLFIGSDSTYLWRRNVGDHLFYRFWGQAIRHVAHRDDSIDATIDAPVVPPISTHHEWDDLNVNRQRLAAIADRTGGKLIELDQLATLPAMIPKIEMPPGRSWERDLWDNWLMLALLVCIYCIDVAVRRWNGIL